MPQLHPLVFGLQPPHTQTAASAPIPFDLSAYERGQSRAQATKKSKVRHLLCRYLRIMLYEEMTQVKNYYLRHFSCELFYISTHFILPRVLL